MYKLGLRFVVVVVVMEEEDGDGFCWSVVGEGGFGCFDEEVFYDFFFFLFYWDLVIFLWN